MSGPTIGFVGGGRVVRIMLTGWQRAGRSWPRVVVSDSDGGPLERLRQEFPAVTVTNGNRAAASQDIVFLAIHPPAFPAALEEIKGSLSANTVVVSLAPKWTMAKIGDLLAGFRRLARVIPNAPSVVARGFNPVTFSPELAPNDREGVRGLLAPLGQCPEVAENTLEAYAIVAAMGPTYFWHQFYQLVDLGVEFGLARSEAMAALTAMVEGATATMTAANLSPDAVMDLIPVKPMASLEPTLKQAYAETLGGLHRKLTS